MSKGNNFLSLSIKAAVFSWGLCAVVFFFSAVFNCEGCNPEKKRGEECWKLFECEEGYICNNQRCVPYGGNGQTCGTDPEGMAICNKGLVCVDTTCRKPGREGAACYLDSHCAKGYVCEQGYKSFCVKAEERNRY